MDVYDPMSLMRIVDFRNNLTPFSKTLVTINFIYIRFVTFFSIIPNNVTH